MSNRPLNRQLCRQYFWGDKKSHIFLINTKGLRLCIHYVCVINQSGELSLGWWEPQRCRRHGSHCETVWKQLYDSTCSMSLSVPDSPEELRTAGFHRHRDDLCLTHLGTAREKKEKRRVGGRALFTFTCFIFFACMGRRWHFISYPESSQKS